MCIHKYMASVFHFNKIISFFRCYNSFHNNCIPIYYMGQNRFN